MEHFIKENLTMNQAINAIRCGVAKYMVYADSINWRWSALPDNKFCMYRKECIDEESCTIYSSIPIYAKYHLSNRLQGEE